MPLHLTGRCRQGQLTRCVRSRNRSLMISVVFDVPLFAFDQLSSSPTRQHSFRPGACAVAHSHLNGIEAAVTHCSTASQAPAVSDTAQAPEPARPVGRGGPGRRKGVNGDVGRPPKDVRGRKGRSTRGRSTSLPNTPWDWHRTADQFRWLTWGQCKQIWQSHGASGTGVLKGTVSEKT